MSATRIVAGAAALAAVTLWSLPSQAATAYQYWAQGRGAFVSSKDRLSTWQDDIGWHPPRDYYYDRREWRGDPGYGYAPAEPYGED